MSVSMDRPALVFRHDSLVSLRRATLITFAFSELKRRKTRADAAVANKL